MQEEFRTDRKSRNRLMEAIELDNGLTVELWDRSKEMYSERWLARLTAKMAVPLEGSFFGDDPVALGELRDEFGETLTFERDMERIFVPAADLDATLEGIIEDFRDNTLKYLENKKFAGNFALKTLGEMREKKRLAELMARG